MLNQIYIHYINTLFVLEFFIISCWLLKGKKIGIGIGQFARKKSVSESATKNHDRCITTYVAVRKGSIVGNGGVGESPSLLFLVPLTLSGDEEGVRSRAGRARGSTHAGRPPPGGAVRF